VNNSFLSSGFRPSRRAPLEDSFKTFSWSFVSATITNTFPTAIQVDNGTEFTSRVVDQWAYQNQVALHFIERGKPTQNALIESFNGKFRDECLNQNWFVDLRHAREVIEAWRVDYNTVRPHSSLRYLTREEFAASAATRPASPPTPVVSITPAWANSDVQEPRSANL